MKPFRRGSLRHVALLALVLLPLSAQAHLVSTGLGPLYDGIGHFFLSIEDLLPLLALCALGGLRGPVGGRLMIFALPVVWGLAALTGALLPASGSLPPWLVPALAIALGVLVALDVALPNTALLLAILITGGSLGVLSGSALSAQTGASLMLLGSFSSLCVVAALVAGATVFSARGARWRRIVVRVSGSWIAAFGLLMVGWLLRVAHW